MAKKQTRRTISISAQHHKRATVYAASNWVPASQLTEFALDQVMSGPLDMEAFRAWNDRREQEWREQLANRVAAAPAGLSDEPPRPVRSAPTIRQPTEDDRVDCSGLFRGVGRKPDPGCNSRKAAVLVLDGGRTQHEAAAEFGVSQSTVSVYVKKLRAERAAP